MIVPLRAARAEDCGGKAAPLGALLRAGLDVPDGFVVPFGVHREAAHNREPADPAGLTAALGQALAALGDPPVAVRSSASGEDTAQGSAAGQHESVLAVRGAAEVAAAVRACRRSLHAPRAAAYREARGEEREPAMAVLVQRLVDAEVSGVLFTPGEPGGATMIEASWGLGPSVVGGLVTPDAYRVAIDGSIERTIAAKRTRLDREDIGLVTRTVPPSERDRPTLDEATVTRIAALGRRIADVLGGPQDIEWAITGERIWILQARPITVDPPAPRPTVPRDSSTTLTGTPGSHGTATGLARIVRGPADFAHVQAGDILVCPHTDPAWTPLLRLAAGVVTETGGLLAHAAIVARELRIPAVLGVPDATRQIAEETIVRIDGSTGTVSTTTIQR